MVLINSVFLEWPFPLGSLLKEGKDKRLIMATGNFKSDININKSKKRNVIAWTINSKLEAIKMKNCCDTITFEGFKPI